MRPPPPTNFQGRPVPEGTRLAGWAALVHALDLRAPVRQPSCISGRHVAGNQRTEAGFRIFDKRYSHDNQLVAHLNFALRHENIDLLALKRALEAMPKSALETFIRATPAGTQARRVWFFYETLTGQTLDIEDAPSTAAVNALDPKKYFTNKGRISRRHKVRDNLLGHGAWCPVIRRTKRLEAFIALDMASHAAQIAGRAGQHLLSRAASFMLLADSRASFEIEGERAPRDRLERWGRAVLQAGRNPLTLEEVLRLHRVLMERARFSAPGLRPDGVFLGERNHLHEPMPEFIGARPQDLDSLCHDLLAANDRMRDGGLDPVLQAAATAFGFVYVHPFQDGNGRLHRCLVHHVLAERNYTPAGVIFPVSSIMLSRIDDYRRTLQDHSALLLDFIQWRTTAEYNVEVLNDTADLYRYFDCTDQAEFLCACVQRTVERDLPREIDYLRRHDTAMGQIAEMIDMPNRLAQDLVRFVRENDGTLSKKKRSGPYASLTDEEVSALEAIVRGAFDGFDGFEGAD